MSYTIYAIYNNYKLSEWLLRTNLSHQRKIAFIFIININMYMKQFVLIIKLGIRKGRMQWCKVNHCASFQHTHTHTYTHSHTHAYIQCPKVHYCLNKHVANMLRYNIYIHIYVCVFQRCGYDVMLCIYFKIV